MGQLAVGAAAIVCIGIAFVSEFLDRKTNTNPSEFLSAPVMELDDTEASKKYTCDGRIYCSEMNSKQEAQWFSRHCPGTKMDGDGDSEACESDSRFY